jgi:hypothetical protein
LKGIGCNPAGQVHISPAFFGHYLDIAAAKQSKSALGRANFRYDVSSPTGC